MTLGEVGGVQSTLHSASRKESRLEANAQDAIAINASVRPSSTVRIGFFLSSIGMSATPMAMLKSRARRPSEGG